MKSIILTLFLCILFLNLSGQGKGTMIKEACSIKNLTIESITEDNALFPYIIDEDRKGVIELHPFSMDEIGGWDVFLSSLSNDSEITFSYIGNKTSRLYEGAYFRFQQLYKGVPVEDGGFTVLVKSDDPEAYIPPPCDGCPGPCDQVFMLAPRIYEDINIVTSPSLNNASIESMLERQVVTRIDDRKLKIVNNLNRNCEYKLVYEVNYSTVEKGDLVGWLDAHTGEILYNTSRHNNKNAPTTDVGVQFMNDQEDGNSQEEGNSTVLRNDRLTVYDMSGVTEFVDFIGGTFPVVNTNQLNNSFANNQVPTSPVTRDWVAADATTNVFQAFWMTDQVIDAFETALGIVFEDVHIGIHPTADGATSFGPAHPDDSANFTFGVFGGNSVVEFDVIAHELGHTVIREFISTAQIDGGSLHEAIADMFGTYIESILDPNGLDWVTGDDIPFVVRDLQNTNRNCFTNIQNLTSVHDRSEALGHWFFLCVNGDAINNIPPMNIDEVISLVYEALPSLGDNPDYPDLMEATMDLAENVYGTCSDQFLSILRSWEQICVPTGHRMATPNAPCAIITGNASVCEEGNTIDLCLSSNTGLNTASGTWHIIGRNSTTFESVQGMQGNAQQGGECLEIDEIPEMPYYPQIITVRYTHPDIGQAITRRVTIRDCDNDDPTCGKYYNTQGLVQNNDETNTIHSSQSVQIRENELNQYTEKRKLIVYDLMGNRLDITEENIKYNQYGNRPQIVIFTYWNQNGELVASKKVLIH